MEIAAKEGKISGLPQYEFAASKILNGRLLLCGDAAHMASPRTAVGAHTAVLDAAGLYQAFVDTIKTKPRDIEELIDLALKSYEQPGLLRARQLFERSKEVSAPVSIQVLPY
jgi:2-polyprenyl-6-methoxyphenol hydroxylase-like FAD-dependent oxidoreductase